MIPIAAAAAPIASPAAASAGRGRPRVADPGDGGFAAALDAAATSGEVGAGDHGGPNDEPVVAEAAAPEDAMPAGSPVVADVVPRLETWNAWLTWSGPQAQDGASSPVVEPDTPPAEGDGDVASVVPAGEGGSTGLPGELPAGAVTVGVSASPVSHGDADEPPADAAGSAPSGQLGQTQGITREGHVRRTTGALPSSPQNLTSAQSAPSKQMPAEAGEPAAPPRVPAAATSGAPEANLAPIPAGATGLVTQPADITTREAARSDASASFDAAALEATGFAGEVPGDHDAATTGVRIAPDTPGTRLTDAPAISRTEPAPTGGVEAGVVAAVPLARAADAASMAVPVEPASGGEVASAVVDQIVRSLRMQWRQGVGEARIQLRPEHLGPVDISLKVEAGVVTAVVRAESAQVQEWMIGNQQSLRQQLEAAGLRLDDLVVSRDADRRRERDQEAPAERRAVPRRRRDGEPEPRFTVVV